MNNRHRVQKTSAGHRWIWLLTASVLIALTVELIVNYPSFTTAQLAPDELCMQDFTCSDDQVTTDDEGTHIQLPISGTVDLQYGGLDTELQTVTVTLQGQGTVNVTLFIRDEACYQDDQFISSAYCVTDSEALRVCRFTAKSAGMANELTLRFNNSAGAEFTVQSVIVNAPIPFQLQPVRMGMLFLISLALFSCLFLHGHNTVYDPRRRAHRLILILPMVGMMSLACFVSAWIQPETSLFTGMTDEEALNSQTDSYAVLFETLRDGRLSLAKQPGEALLALGNPYDSSERHTIPKDCLFDYALYNGQYYVYYGLAPILTVYSPYRLLTGRVPASRDAALLLGCLAIGFTGWAVCGLAKRYVRDTNVYALSLCCVAAVFSSGILILISSADFYYLAELSFVCFCAGSIASGLHAAQQKRRWLSRLQYLLSGVCFALTLMSRANALPILIAMLAPIYICELAQKRAGLREALAFLLPALLGAGIVMYYNAARFGSVFDFGALHQLTVTDVHYRQVDLMDLPGALYHYLFEPVILTEVFPYLSIVSHKLPTVGHYVFILSCFGVFVFPVALASVLAFFRSHEDISSPPLLQRERRWVYRLPLLVSIPIMLVSYSMAGAILRYTCDFRLFYTLVGIACLLPYFRDTVTENGKLLKSVFLLLCMASILIGISTIFINERDYIKGCSPQIYYGLQRMLFPY